MTFQYRLQGTGCNKLRTGLTMLGMIIGVSAWSSPCWRSAKALS